MNSRVTVQYSPYENAWILAAGNFLGQPAAVAGPAHLDLQIQHSVNGPVSVTVRAELGYRPAVFQGGPLDDQVWRAVQSWPDEQARRRQPAELEALLELADRHRAEYASLREKIGVIRALGG